MRRDALATKNHETNVTEQHRTDRANLPNSSQIPSTEPLLRVTEGVEYNDYNVSATTKRTLYNSYDPNVGINTAAVLGGILLVLVVYVIYRTRCRKRLLRLIEACSMKYFPEDFPTTVDCKPPGLCDTGDEGHSEWMSERAKMIWKERELLSRDPEKYPIDNSAMCLSGETSVSPMAQHRDTCEDIDIDIEPDDGDGHEFYLPEAEEDIIHSTAQWVQNVTELDHKERQLNGIILRIPPDLLSSTAKVRSQFHSVRDYDETNEFAHISVRNKSLPLLIESESLIKSNYANDARCNNSRLHGCIIRAPLASQEDFGSEMGSHYTEQQSRTKAPLDICPIVKVQHYHSRSKRRLTSICRTSSEESSCSSDDPSVRGPTKINSIGQAKYKRLHSDDFDRFGSSVPREQTSMHPNVKQHNNVHMIKARESFETSL